MIFSKHTKQQTDAGQNMFESYIRPKREFSLVSNISIPALFWTGYVGSRDSLVEVQVGHRPF